MIKLNIKNVQSIENIELSFDGFTVIRGSSDIGKTALMKSVLGLVSNTAPRKLLRSGTSKLEVDLELTKHKDFKDIKCSWIKGGDESSYIINDKVFTKIGASDISNFSNDIAIVTKPLSPQIRTQYDQLFLLEVSSNEFFNNLISGLALEKLQKILKLMQDDQNELKTTAKIKAKDLDLLLSQKKEIDSIFEINAETFNIFKILYKKILESEKRIELCEKLLINYKINLKNLNGIDKDINQYQERFNQIAQRIEKQKQLKILLQVIYDAGIRKQNIQTTITECSTLFKILPEISALKNKADKITAILDIHSLLCNNKNRGVELNLKIDDLLKKKNQLEVDIKAIGICPTCRRKLNA